MATNKSKLLSKFKTPLQAGYCPKLHLTEDMKSDGVQYYNYLIGVLRCYV